MTVKEVSDALSLRYLSGEELSRTREVCGCYCGDLLSWVMSRAKEGNLWLTVMGNINAIGVAALSELSAIVLTENAALDAEALKKAEENGVILLTTPKNTYETAAAVSRLLDA